MQVFVLCGGFGTRLAHIVKDVPKPMAPIGNSPFLEIQLRQLMKVGASSFVLLTGHKAEQIEDYFSSHNEFSPLVRFSRESSPLGTGGALRQALLEFPPTEPFAVANGDTFLDCDLGSLLHEHVRLGAVATLAVKYRADCSRYGKIEPDDLAVVRFLGKEKAGGEGLINAGLYICSPDLVHKIPAIGFVSLESAVFPLLAGMGLLFAIPCEGRFIDIGVEEDYRRAQQNLLSWISAPKSKAAFLDRDGILIEDPGYLRRPEDVRLRQDVIPVVKQLQELGYLLIVCTNQAGIAKGIFSLSEYEAVAARMDLLLKQQGITITESYMCPFHEDAVLPQYKRKSYCRKPNPGMVLQAAEKYNIDLGKSFMIGDKESDRIALPVLRTYLLQGNYKFLNEKNAFTSVEGLAKELFARNPTP